MAVQSQGGLFTLLRTRGGISIEDTAQDLQEDSSPHTRRYFQVRHSQAHEDGLFSAHAEVFPSSGQLQ